MNFVLKWSGVVALVILAAVGISNSLPSQQQLGVAVDCSSVTCFTTVGILTSLQVDGTAIYNGLMSLTAGLKVGTSGSTLTLIKVGTCSSVFADSTMVATSTTQATCTDSAVLAGDVVVATMATPTLSTPIRAGNFVAENAIATTTGSFGVTVRNVTGGATSSINAAYQKINYSVYR